MSQIALDAENTKMGPFVLRELSLAGKTDQQRNNYSKM